VMVALCQAVGRPPPPETVEIRESFLQAAKFVGREEEMAHFQVVLRAALDGQGSAWLVGGESGVGKSRLLEELRTRALVEGVLVLRGQDNPVVTVEGFSNANIVVVEVTDPAAPRVVTGAAIDGGADNYRVTFTPSAPDAVYVAFTPGGAYSPQRVWPEIESALKDNSNNANYLVIAPSALKATAQTLADYRQGQGLQAKVVDLEDVYDEFNYGLAGPRAIRDFLGFAYTNWSSAPQYVLLAGDGSFDYKNNLGNGDSLIPPILVSTPDGLYASDNRLADVTGDDGLPEMAIGRLPVLSAAELQAVIDKIMAYEASAGGDWQKQVLMLADEFDQEAGYFSIDSDNVAQLVPAAYNIQTIYLPAYSPEQARQQIIASINNGVGVVNYFGHGAPDRLGNISMMDVNDVNVLTNGDKLPVMAGMTCLIGRYEMPGFDSLSERLVLKDNGGAVAVWSPTGLSLNPEARRLDEAFFTAAFATDQPVIGQVVLQALNAYHAQGGEAYMVDIYNMLSDPALRMR